MISPVSVCLPAGRIYRRITQKLLKRFPPTIDGGSVLATEKTPLMFGVNPDKGTHPGCFFSLSLTLQEKSGVVRWVVSLRETVGPDQIILSLFFLFISFCVTKKSRIHLHLVWCKKSIFLYTYFYILFRSDDVVYTLTHVLAKERGSAGKIWNVVETFIGVPFGHQGEQRLWNCYAAFFLMGLNLSSSAEYVKEYEELWKLCLSIVILLRLIVVIVSVWNICKINSTFWKKEKNSLHFYLNKEKISNNPLVHNIQTDGRMCSVWLKFFSTFLI